VERPYRAFGYPIVPALYVIGATVILVVLFMYQTATTWPGLMIVLTGVPVYFSEGFRTNRRLPLRKVVQFDIETHDSNKERNACRSIREKSP